MQQKELKCDTQMDIECVDAQVHGAGSERPGV